MGGRPSTLLIACGALAWEVTELIRRGGWTHFAVQCLPAHWHNTPQKIPDAVRAKIRENRDRFERIFVLYGDCGTGGLLDAVLAEEGVERIEGPHCYEFYAGASAFAALHDEEPGTFYLTDYLVKHFDRLIIQGLGLDRYPQLRDDYFGNYRRLVYLAQVGDPALVERAQAAADRLGLAFQLRPAGYGTLADFMARAAKEKSDGKADRRPVA
ncbi:MAG: DUF1638 domain-containing protein [Alphaproteobacteria bacterium]|nr:DUF1638 domain-containing protein [Alphaproteobacteria bacterium]